RRVRSAELRNMIGGGARALIERALGEQRVTVTRGDVDRLYESYIAHYADHIAEASRLFPGLEQALDARAENGCRFAVCSNKLEFLAVRLLEELSIAGRCAAVGGQDTARLPTADAELGGRSVGRRG